MYFPGLMGGLPLSMAEQIASAQPQQQQQVPMFAQDLLQGIQGVSPEELSQTLASVPGAAVPEASAPQQQPSFNPQQLMMMGQVGAQAGTAIGSLLDDIIFGRRGPSRRI